MYAAANADRQMFPVHTKSTLKLLPAEALAGSVLTVDSTDSSDIHTPSDMAIHTSINTTCRDYPASLIAAVGYDHPA